MSPTAYRLDPTASVRVDVRTRIQERATRLGGPDQILAVVHTPPDRVLGGLLICSPIAAELRRNYRREVLLSRALAARGIAVLRFHYRGSGHSDGDESDLTWEAMLDDSLTAVEHLMECMGSPRLAFLGTRLAAPLSAAIAARHAAAPLVLWEPVLQPPDHFREVLRTRLVYGIRQKPDTARGRTRSTADLFSQLTTDGYVDVLGYAIHRGLVESFWGRSLEAELVGGERRRILLVQLSRRSELRPVYKDLEDRMARHSFQIDTRIVEVSEDWWFESEHVRSSAPDRRLVRITADWLVRFLNDRG